MPRFDGGGPRGFGPMTGRGFGYCAVPYPSRAVGAGFGRGFGRRRGYGYWELTSEESGKEFLEAERDMLKARLKAIEEELEDL